MMQAMESAKFDIVQKLLQYVRDNGTDVTNYDRQIFGLDVDEDDDHIITQVLNLYGNNGCYFFEPDRVNEDGLNDMTDENWSDLLYEHIVHTAYQCLYIVVDANGDERLRYYRFTNGGLTFDDDQADPDHGDCYTLNLIDLHYLLQAININF